MKNYRIFEEQKYMRGFIGEKNIDIWKTERKQSQKGSNKLQLKTKQKKKKWRNDRNKMWGRNKIVPWGRNNLKLKCST